MCTYNTFAPNLVSERLTLRPYRPEDAPRVRALANDIDVARMVASIPYPYPEGLAEKWISMHPARHAANTGYPFAIEIDGQVAGSIGVESEAHGHGTNEFELGYWLGREYWGRGYASEAAHAAISFAFEVKGIPYVRARFLRDNRASARVLTKAGFLATGRYTTFHKVRACEVEVTATILTRDAWTSNRV
ncbi:MAG: GNAT family N-acetyltransferase [Rhodospirillaceae bacterium]|nr:GNAT family N-acetyltransferase [Rhodospirillaceae bacterium]